MFRCTCRFMNWTLKNDWWGTLQFTYEFIALRDKNFSFFDEAMKHLFFGDFNYFIWWHKMHKVWLMISAISAKSFQSFTQSSPMCTHWVGTLLAKKPCNVLGVNKSFIFSCVHAMDNDTIPMHKVKYCFDVTKLLLYYLFCYPPYSVNNNKQ